MFHRSDSPSLRHVLGASLAAAAMLSILLLNPRPLRTAHVSAAQALHLPYAGGLAVQIIQGYNGGTHQGVERYSLDLTRADGATAGSPVLAPASGTVAFAEDPGAQHGCIGVAIDGDGDLHYMLCHVILTRSFTYGEAIQFGQPLGTVGAPGLVGNNGVAHVHMQLYTLPGGVRTPVPYAAPDGLSLDGVSMPPDGSYNQWMCVGSSCHGIVSSNVPLGSATPTSRSNGSAASPAPSATSGTTASFSIGQSVTVSGTGDCLRIHAQPGISAQQVACLKDGSTAITAEGPTQADGQTWWRLLNAGWASATYLAPSTVTNASGVAQPAATDIISTSSSAAPTSLSVGSLVRVSGTGDCLKLHASAGLTADGIGCLADGTLSAIHDGPKSADGHTWWQLDGGGWAVGDYLQLVAGT